MIGVSEFYQRYFIKYNYLGSNYLDKIFKTFIDVVQSKLYTQCLSVEQSKLYTQGLPIVRSKL